MTDRFIEQLLSRQIDGGTFNFDGSPFDWPGDVVTLTSCNIVGCADAEFSPEFVESFIGQYRHAEVPQLCYGVFRLADGRISIDINVCVDEQHRANTYRFSVENGQESFWSGSTQSVVPTHGFSTPKLRNYADVVNAALKLVRGEAVGL